MKRTRVVAWSVVFVGAFGGWRMMLAPSDSSDPTKSSAKASRLDPGLDLPPPELSPPASIVDGAAREDPVTISMTCSDKLTEGVPESVTIHDGVDDYEAIYTGKIVRSVSVLFFPVTLYEVVSYVENPSALGRDELLDGMLEDGFRKVFLLRFLKPLPGPKILAAIQEEIDATFTDVDMDRLQQDVDRFVQPFSQGSSKGDTVYMTWLPGGRIYSGYKTPDEIELIARDVPLARAIWRIWAGGQTGDERLSLVKRFVDGE